MRISIGKLAPVPGLRAAIIDLGFERLPIEDAHLAVLEELPLRHRDPFDRLLISQAVAEGIAVLTADEVFGDYGLTVHDARL